MPFAFLFQLSIHPRLRARLAACLVLAFLAIGLLDLVAYRGILPMARAATPAAVAHGVPEQGEWREAPGHPAQLRELSRARMAAARSQRFEEIQTASASVDWPDLEKGPPGLPRFSICKIPSEEDPDDDTARRDRPRSGSRSRAPPALT